MGNYNWLNERLGWDFSSANRASINFGNVFVLTNFFIFENSVHFPYVKANINQVEHCYKMHDINSKIGFPY